MTAVLGLNLLLDDIAMKAMYGDNSPRPEDRDNIPSTIPIFVGNNPKDNLTLSEDWVNYVKRINSFPNLEGYYFQFTKEGFFQDAVGWHNVGGGYVVEQVTFSGNIVEVYRIEGNRAFIRCCYNNEAPPTQLVRCMPDKLHPLIQLLTTQHWNKLDITTDGHYPQTLIMAKDRSQELWIDARNMIKYEEPKMSNTLPAVGKGCYIWRPQNIFNGDISKIVQMMVDAHVNHVCIKVSDGWYTYPNMSELASRLRAAGIIVGAWGYVYLKWIPTTEADAIVLGAKQLDAAYLLHDIEDAAAFFQWTNGSKYMNRVKALLPRMPMAMNSYWKISGHPEIPWSSIRNQCDFDAPQIYSRGTDPVQKYNASKLEYANKKPRLPFALPAGDMYFEGGIKPRPGDITKFMQRAKLDPEAKGVVMWAADQRETTPELWAEFAAFHWDLGTVDPIPPVTPPVYEPLYAAVVIADFLYIRNRPDASGGTQGYYKKGDRVTVYGITGSWSCVDAEKDLWCGSRWLKRL